MQAVQAAIDRSSGLHHSITDPAVGTSGINDIIRTSMPHVDVGSRRRDYSYFSMLRDAMGGLHEEESGKRGRRLENNSRG